MEQLDKRILALPNELQLHISEFNYEHRETFRPTLEVLKDRAISYRVDSLIERYINSDNFSNRYTSLIDQIDKEIQDRELFVNHFSKCSCCPRHMKCRPSQVGEIWNTYNTLPTTNTEEPGEIPCRCSCRHFSRQFATLFETHYY